MKIRIICPAPPRTLYGNRITALRWARVLKDLGHHVTIQTAYDAEACDLLVALHAKRSASAVIEFHKQYPDKPVIVALTGTDLYRDIHRSRLAQRALDIAARLVAFQPLACEQLAPHLHGKLRVIYQSVDKTPGPVARPDRAFQVCVIGHLRNIKDPFRTAMAARNLPASSRIQIVHAGAAMDDRMSRRAHLEAQRAAAGGRHTAEELGVPAGAAPFCASSSKAQRAAAGGRPTAEELGLPASAAPFCASSSKAQRNPRYRWLGEISRSKTRRLIAASHLLVLSSQMEGGANVISEAIVDRTPVLASRIPGSIGLLGADYPGFYPYRDTVALRDLLHRAETDEAFYHDLSSRCAKLAHLFQPERERTAWRHLLREL